MDASRIPSRRSRAGAARPSPRKKPFSFSSLKTLTCRLLDPADTRAALLVALLILVGEALLTGLIIRRVPCEFEERERERTRSTRHPRCARPPLDLSTLILRLHAPFHTDTEIDWSTYMEQLRVIDKVGEREREREKAWALPHTLFSISHPHLSISFLFLH